MQTIFWYKLSSEEKDTEKRNGEKLLRVPVEGKPIPIAPCTEAEAGPCLESARAACLDELTRHISEASACRLTESTNLNDQSSRSHMVFLFELTQQVRDHPSFRSPR